MIDEACRTSQLATSSTQKISRERELERWMIGALQKTTFYLMHTIVVRIFLYSDTFAFVSIDAFASQCSAVSLGILALSAIFGPATFSFRLLSLCCDNLFEGLNVFRKTRFISVGINDDSRSFRDDDDDHHHHHNLPPELPLRLRLFQKFIIDSTKYGELTCL